MADLQETLGQVIRRLRQDQQLTLHELAERAALSEVYLGEVERGKKYPSARVLEQLAEGLAIDVPDLLQEVAGELRAAMPEAVLAPIGFHAISGHSIGNGRPTGTDNELLSSIGLQKLFVFSA